MALPHRALSRQAFAVASSSSRSCARPIQPHCNSNRISKQHGNNNQLLLIQTRTKRSAAKNNDRKSAISRAITENQARGNSNSNSNSVSEAAETEYIFGLRPVDYSISPPIRHPPPPPPSKPGMQRYLSPVILLFTAGTVGYFYMNNQNDNYAYWEAMQSGDALAMDDDEDDDDDWEDEEEGDEADEGGGDIATALEPTKLASVVDVNAGDNSETKQKRGWFGWFRRGQKSGNDVNEISPSDGQ